MKISVGWDSAPVAIYRRADEGRGFYREIVDVPEEVFERFDAAEKAYQEAEEALHAAVRKAKEEKRRERSLQAAQSGDFKAFCAAEKISIL